MTNVEVAEIIGKLYLHQEVHPQEGAVFTTDPVNELDTQPGTQVVMTGADQAALAANPNRKYASFINLSDHAIALGIGEAAVADTGIVLTAKGSSYEVTKGNLFLGEVRAIGTAADMLGVTEGE